MPLVADVPIVALTPGSWFTAPHGVSESGVGLMPNLCLANPPWPLEVMAVDPVNISFRNNDPTENFTGSVRCVKLHTIIAPDGLSGVGAILSVCGLSTTDKSAVNGALMKYRGAPMTNRLRLLGAPGIITQGNFITIGADVYEFRNSSPPAGGTAGRIWVHNGFGGAANAVIARASLIKAINNVIEPAFVTRTAQDPAAGNTTELYTAMPGVTLGDIILVSTTSPGGSIRLASATATAVARTLDTATDIWDQATMLGGRAAGQKEFGYTAVTVSAANLAKGSIEAQFTFVPTHFLVINRMRNQDEARSVVDRAVSIVLAGGPSPNNQIADVLDVLAWG